MARTAKKGESFMLKWRHLFTLRAVVVGVQNLDLYSGFGSKDPVAGSNVEKVIVLLFTVQGLSDKDLPFILNVFDSKLAEWIPT